MFRSAQGDIDLQQVPVAIVTSALVSRDQRERLSRRAQSVLQKSELDVDRRSRS